MRKALNLFLGLTSCAMLSHASLTPVNQLISDNGNGTYTWFYEITLDTLQQIDSNNVPVVTLYDFYGYVPGSLNVITPDWTGDDTATITAPPSGALPLGGIDDPLAINFTFTYTGVLPAVGDAIEGVGDPVLTFSANSIYSQVRLSPFSSKASKDNDGGADEGTFAGNQGSYEAPQSVIPEPASMSLIGGAFLALGAFRKRLMKR
jgi:hypothetical protein